MLWERSTADAVMSHMLWERSTADALSLWGPAGINHGQVALAVLRSRTYK